MPSQVDRRCEDRRQSEPAFAAGTAMAAGARMWLRQKHQRQWQRPPNRQVRVLAAIADCVCPITGVPLAAPPIGTSRFRLWLVQGDGI